MGNTDPENENLKSKPDKKDQSKSEINKGPNSENFENLSKQIDELQIKLEEFDEKRANRAELNAFMSSEREKSLKFLSDVLLGLGQDEKNLPSKIIAAKGQKWYQSGADTILIALLSISSLIILVKVLFFLP